MIRRSIVAATAPAARHLTVAQPLGEQLEDLHLALGHDRAR